MSDTTVQNEPAQKAESVSRSPLAPMADKASLPTGGGDCIFNDFITISTTGRIPHYDKGSVLAYTAQGSDKYAQNLFALICEDHLTPRTMKANNYAAINNHSLVRLVAAGIVNWAPAGKEKFCLIYENTLGAPLMKEDTYGGLGLKPEIVLNNVIRPIITVFEDMRDKDLVHGNIRAANIFNGGSANFERAVLGECLAIPPSYNQPTMYEPIDRAMTSPAGRGMGTQMDDLYSFGVALAVLMRHMDPTEGMTDDEIIERKMEEGSYSALLGRDRFTGAILELLRGLLQDDETQRWTLEEVLIWLDGRRLSPKQAHRRSKATRPILFNGQKYFRPEILAKDLGKNPGEVKQVIENGEMEQWLTRALEDKATTARYENALKQSADAGKTASHADVLATRLGIALHPTGPIRYKSISIQPEGIGSALSEAYIMKRDMNAYVDFFMHYFITQWIDSQSGNVVDVSSLISKFDGARAYLRHKGIGMGIEKCIYAMNPDVHCLSDKLSKFYVRTPEELMHAYEKLSKMPSRPIMFFDRHVVAFLSVKDRKNIDPYMYDLNAPEPYRKIMAEMRTLATIQKRSQMGVFPGIGDWMIENLGPVYERFHDSELKEALRKKVERLKGSGDLARILMIFDNPVVYQEDNSNFRRSMRRYYDFEQEVADIERQLRDESSLGKEWGRQIAAICAGILAGIIVLATGFMAFGNSGSKLF